MATEVQGTGSRPAKGKIPPQFVGHTFKPGQSGNPSGRRKGASFTELAKMKMGKSVPKEIALKFGRKKMTWAEVFVERAFRAIAARMSVTELDKVLDRTDGKPAQNVNLNADVKQESILFGGKELTRDQWEKLFDSVKGECDKNEG